MTFANARSPGAYYKWKEHVYGYSIGKRRCPVCVDSTEEFTIPSPEFENHKNFSTVHKYNYFSHQFRSKRKRQVTDRHGVKITATCEKREVQYNQQDGTVKTVLAWQDTEEQLVYKFEVSNTNSNPILICDVFLLHPYPVFEILPWNTSHREIPANSCRTINVSFHSEAIGCYNVPLVFWLQRSSKEKPFFIIRVMEIEIVRTSWVGELPNSPYTGDTWIGIKYTVYGFTKNGKLLQPLQGYEVTEDHKRMFQHWMKDWKNMSDEGRNSLSHVQSVSMGGYSSLKDHYQPFFHMLLYLEEYETSVALESYNMSRVQLVLWDEYDHYLLQVPGLAEKRPSILVRDLIYVREHFPDGTLGEHEYQAQVTEVRESSILLSHFNPCFHELFAKNPNVMFDVRFTFSRLPIVVTHKAIDLVVENNLLKVVFPSESKLNPPLIENIELRFFNQSIESNDEQIIAVRNILAGECRPAPYIIHGPPGTGKSVTIVEAILQIKKLFSGSYVLLCAPSNAACDFLTEKLAKYCTPSELLRLHSSTRDWSTVPESIHKYSNRSESQYYTPPADILVTYRVIVCTLITGSRFVTLLKSVSREHFTHVFIDECGQAQEPEALASVGGILGPVRKKKIGGQLIIAGDPKQLGPGCSSRLAEKVVPPDERHEDDLDDELSINNRIGLGVSLLERLMYTCDVYKSAEGLYDSCYITKLRDNYRSHPAILTLPNRLFYDGELQAKCPESIREDPLHKSGVLGKRWKGQAVIFDGVMGHEQKEGRSPSFFNTYELDRVVIYLDKLLSSGTVKQGDIGVIAPYIRQVYKLKRKLQEMNWSDVEVGTTEVFQGREKRVIIISTVRANKNLVDTDKKFQIGFLSNAKRFNVAITRAQSLLIVIGNPFMIGTDKHWLALMKYSLEELNSYIGCKYEKRDEKWKKKVVDNMSKIIEIK